MRYLSSFRKKILDHQKTAAHSRKYCKEKFPQPFPTSNPNSTRNKKMLTPDHHTTKLGSKDFIFQVNKWPFSITCNPLLPVITECFIDLGLVKDMKINMKKLECRNMSYGGYPTKVVGSISQTVQVVYDGVASGTMHLKAKVIRNLTNLYGVDCIASKKLYKLLTHSSEADVSSEASNEVLEHSTDDSVSDSADDIIQNGDDSPRTAKRKRKRRFQIANLSFTSSLMSSPGSTANPARVENPNANKNSLSPGQPNRAKRPTPAGPKPSPKPTYLTPAEAVKTYLYPAQVSKLNPPPPPRPKPPVPLQLQELVFCGLREPCPCVHQLRPAQLQLLPPHYPVYLPRGQLPCDRDKDCGCHHVHRDNIHPPNPQICPCDPPRLSPDSWHCRAVQVPLHLQDGPSLPPDFLPCGYRCVYEDCECLRQYPGYDWDS